MKIVKCTDLDGSFKTDSFYTNLEDKSIENLTYEVGKGMRFKINGLNILTSNVTYAASKGEKTIIATENTVYYLESEG